MTETVNALLAGTQVRRLLVTGEVRISLGPVSPWTSHDADVAGRDGGARTVPLRISSGGDVERLTPHPDFVRATLHAASGTTAYVLDVDAVHRAASRAARAAEVPEQHNISLPLFKYQVVRAPRASVPLDVGVQWRVEPAQASMVVNYVRNDECAAALRATPMTVLTISAALGAPVHAARSQPTGQWDEASQCIAWHLLSHPHSDTAADPDRTSLITSSSSTSSPTAGTDTSGRILARFSTAGSAHPQPLSVRWCIAGQTLSSLRLDAPAPASPSGQSAAQTQPEVSWLPPIRTTVAGKYLVIPSSTSAPANARQ